MTRLAHMIVSCLVAAMFAGFGCSARHQLADCQDEYTVCSEDRDCRDGARCEHLRWRDGEGQRCARECSDELECPFERGHPARCYDVNRDGAFRCYQQCDRDSDCPATWVCQPVRSADVISRICLP